MKIMQTGNFVKKYDQSLADLQEIAEALTTRNAHSGLNLEKMHVDMDRITILSARLNQKQRVLFTLLPATSEREMTLLFLDYLPNHEYKRSPFLKPLYLRQFFSPARLEEATLLPRDVDVTDFDPHELSDILADSSVTKEEKKDFAVELYVRPTITLSDEQQDTLRLSLPAVISGVPGSGKTSILEMLLQQQSAHLAEGSKILYITKSPQLVKSAKLAMSDLGLIEQIDIMTMSDLYEWCGKSRNDLDTAYRHSLDSAEKDLAKIKNKLTPETIVKEFPLLVVLNNTEDYLDAGQRQAAFQGANRDIIVSCYERFKREFPEDADLFNRPLTRPEEPWSLIAVDEAQDLDIKTLVDLFDLADNGGIVYSYDPNQNISDNLSSHIDNLTLLRRLIHEKQRLNLSQHFLSKTYRCPPAIAAQATLARAVIGKIVDQHNKTDLGNQWHSKAMLYHIESAQTEESAPVCWIEYNSKDRRFIAAQSLLPDSVQWAVITPQDEKKQAEEIFSTSLVFSIDEIKGLEYKHIIMFNMMKDEAYERIASSLANSRHKKELTESTLHQKMNCLFTAMTRSMESLWIIEEKSYKKSGLFKALGQENALRQEPLLTLQASSQEAILAEVHRLLENQAIAQAQTLYERHGLQDLGQNFETYCMAYQQADKEYASAQLESFRSEKAMSLPTSGKEQVKAIAKMQEEAFVFTDRNEEDKKAQKDIIKKKYSMECLAKHLSDQAAFLRILTMPSGKNRCIAQLIVKDSNPDALKNFINFCCDPRYQERVHLDIFALAVNGKTFLDYLALSEPGRTLITTFFDRIPNEALLVTLKLLQQNGSAAIATKLMGEIKEQLQVLKSKEDRTAFKVKMKELFTQVKKELEIKKSQSQQGNTIRSLHSLQELEQLNAALFHAARQGDASAVTRLLAAGADVNCKDSVGKTLLFYQIANQNMSIIKLLLASPDLKIDQVYNEPATALHIAIFVKNSVISQALMRRDPSIINLTDQEGCTALHHAVEKGLISIVEELLKLGAAITLAHNGCTPLHFAAANNQLAIAQILLNHDPTLLDQQSKDGSSALILACMNQFIDIVKFLIDLKASTAADHQNNTPLHHAVSRANLPIMKVLLQYKGDLLDKPDGRGATALMIASQAGYLSIVQYLLTLKAHITVAANGCTALHLAAYTGHFKIVKALCEYNPRIINTIELGIESESKTALSLAALRKHWDIVQYLLESGAVIEHFIALIAAFEHNNKLMALSLIQHPLLAQEITDFKMEELQQIEAALSLSQRRMPMLLKSKSEWIQELEAPIASFVQSLDKMRSYIESNRATKTDDNQSVSAVTTVPEGQHNPILFSTSTLDDDPKNNGKKDSNQCSLS